MLEIPLSELDLRGGNIDKSRAKRERQSPKQKLRNLTKSEFFDAPWLGYNFTTLSLCAILPSSDLTLTTYVPGESCPINS